MDRNYSRPGRATTQEPLHGKAGRQFAGTPQTRSIARPVAALPPAFENQNRRRAFKCMQTIVSGAAIIALFYTAAGNRIMSDNLPPHIDLTKLREIFLALAKRRVRDEQDAEEIVQDALMTVVEKTPSQTFEKSFLQWAFGVLRNKIGNYYQQRERRHRTTAEITEDTQRTLRSDLPDPLAMSTEAELRGKIQRSWRQLGGQCRRLLWMLYAGYSREEIFAEFPQYHFKVVNTKIFRCRNYLRRLLRQEGYSL